MKRINAATIIEIALIAALVAVVTFGTWNLFSKQIQKLAGLGSIHENKADNTTNKQITINKHTETAGGLSK